MHPTRLGSSPVRSLQPFVFSVAARECYRMLLAHTYMLILKTVNSPWEAIATTAIGIDIAMRQLWCI